MALLIRGELRLFSDSNAGMKDEDAMPWGINVRTILCCASNI